MGRHKTPAVPPKKPSLWLRDPNNKPLRGKCITFGELASTAPLKKGTLDFSKQGAIPLDSIPNVAHRLSVSVADPGPITDTKDAASGVVDKGHYLVTNAGPDGTPDPTTLLVAGQFGDGQPDVMRQVPYRDTAISVFKWNDAARQGKGFKDVQHWFVLMLENRSYDHMLGYNKDLIHADGVLDLHGECREDLWNPEYLPDENNQLKPTGNRIPVRPDAPEKMAVDSGHELTHTHRCIAGWRDEREIVPTGESTNNLAKITMDGFFATYLNRLIKRTVDQLQWDEDAVATHSWSSTDKIDRALNGTLPQDYAKHVMHGFPPGRLPVLNTLATSFAVCDRWFSSLPGPTWPNRLFAHCAQSGGLDDSPTAIASAWKSAGGDFHIPTVYERVMDAGALWNVYGETMYPLARTLHFVYSNFGSNPPGGFCRVVHGDAGFKSLKADISKYYTGVRAGTFTFLEPDYGDLGLAVYPMRSRDDPVGAFDLTAAFGGDGANSQHPVSGVKAGEDLIKSVYAILRNSPIWGQSALIITYDEHGGFYDHVPPPAAVPPGKPDQYSSYSPRTGIFKDPFQFKNYGVRVPTVIISPLIPGGVTDHTIYDHASVAATIQKSPNFPGMKALTNRDATANDFSHLFALEKPRDLPKTVDELPGFTSGG